MTILRIKRNTPKEADPHCGTSRRWTNRKSRPSPRLFLDRRTPVHMITNDIGSVFGRILLIGRR